MNKIANQLGALLMKGGYAVRKTKERENGKENGRWVHVVTFEGDRK